MSPEELLTNAAEIIARDGHFKGNFDDGDPLCGAVCAEGALRRAYFGNSRAETDYGASGALSEAWKRLNGATFQVDGTYATFVYNDYPQTSAEDVILLFKRAAAGD